MIYKKKILIFSIFLIISIQILLLINNTQKTSLRYFIWNFQNVTIGRLIFVSFLSGLLMSSILNKTIKNNNKANPIIESDDKKNDKNDYSIDREDNNESYETYEMTPERDLRDTQPTISVNYRVIKNNGENELKDRNHNLNNSQYEDDWSSNESEW